MIDPLNQRWAGPLDLTKPPLLVGRSVLVIEDDEPLRLLIERRLQRSGFRTRGAANGTDALALIREATPDVMVLDYTLPDMRGEQLIETLLKQGIDVPFMVATGRGSEAVAVGMMKLGARDYLVKSDAFLELLPTIVSQVLEKIQHETQLAAAETALRDSEHRHQMLSELSPVGIFRSAADGQLHYVNSRWCQLCGRTVEDSLNRDWTDVVCGEDLPHVLSSWQHAISAPIPFRAQFRVLHPDGTTLWVVAQAVAETGAAHDQVGYVGTFTDITDQKRAEAELRSTRDELEQRIAERTANLTHANTQLQQEILERRRVEIALRESESRFRVFAENARDVMYRIRFRPRLKVEYVSPVIHAMTGYTPEDFYSDAFLAIRIVFVRDRHRVLDLCRRPEAFHIPLQLRWVRQDGEMIWMEQRSVPLLDAAGQVVGIEGIHREITERKRAEIALQSERRLLKQLLDMQERDRQLVAYEIHDGLVQYVTGSLMHLEVFARRQPPSDGKPKQEFDHALRLLRDTLREARSLISGLRPPILDEAGIVSAIDYLVNEQRQAGKIQIEYMHQVQFDQLAKPLENTLFRIAQEALTNAVRHSKSQRIRIEFRQLEDMVQLGIQDWGVGFDTKKSHHGRHGLQGVQERARLLGGSALIESAPNQGTRILVKLPLVSPGSSVP